MNECNCSVIRDLLPLYIDGVCSEESKQLVEKHLEECEACREVLQQMREELELHAEAGDAQNGLRRIKKFLKKKYVLFAVSAAAVVMVCVGFVACLQSIETPIEYKDAKVSMVQDKKDPTKYKLVFNGQRYGCLYGEFVDLKEDEDTIYQAEIIHAVSTPWTRMFEKKPFENEVMGNYSADPDEVAGLSLEGDGKKYWKTVAVYYQATPASDRQLLWMADWFRDMEDGQDSQPQSDADQKQ